MPRPCRPPLIAALAALLLQINASALSSPMGASPRTGCPRASASEPIRETTATTEPAQATVAANGEPTRVGRDRDPQAHADLPSDYRQLIKPTPMGWARLDHWCVWVEPVSSTGAGSLWDQRWLSAVEKALAGWQALLMIERVSDPEAAQIRLWRRRPPLRPDADGRMRASHGRAILAIRQVTRDGIERLEPAVEVLLSPGQRQSGIEATALHELGHAFGLWGHSDQPGDAMAAIPGATPVLALSPRDQATVLWLYAQPTPFGKPLAPR